MAERFKYSDVWKRFYQLATDRVGGDPEGTLWQEVYEIQTTLTEIELSNLGVNCETPIDKIPFINKIQNPGPIDPEKELGIVEIVGMPGAGKDTMINIFREHNFPNVECAPEEGYWWDKQIAPFVELRKRNLRAYAGTDMEIDEILDRFKDRDKNVGVGILNRSIQDNFLAFGYSFFLSGYISLGDLLLSQKFFHFYQHVPRDVGDGKTMSLDDLTVATVVCMIDPETTLNRISATRQGRILNKDFLSLLYSQYLRMIARLTEMQWKNLVVLDMRGTKKQNEILFESVMHAIIKLKK